MKQTLIDEITAIAKEYRINVRYPSSVSFIADKEEKEIDLNSFKSGLYEDSKAAFYMSRYRLLSEDFMSLFKDYLRWKVISRGQPLAESFVRKHEEYIDWIELNNNVFIKSEIKRKRNYVFEYYIKEMQLKKERAFYERMNLYYNSAKTLGI